MRKIICLAFIFLLLFTSTCYSIEFVRQKNVATILYFPLKDADGDNVSSAGSLDSEIDAYTDGAVPDGFTDCTNEATEVGSSGWYYLELTQAEVNIDYAGITVKSDNAKEQALVLRTVVGDPLNFATTTSGSIINTASGIVESNVKQVNGTSQTANDNGADINAILIDTAVIGALGAGLTDLGGMSTGMKAEVESECNDALVALNLDHLVIATGAVETSGSNSTTQVQTDLAEATDDHYDVMTILFTSGVEAGQSRLITGYTGASGIVSWNAALTGTPADTVTFIIIAAGTTADAVWDEILTGSSHNISTSAGKRLRQIEESFVHASGTIAAVTDGHTITLDAGAVATADYYVGDRLQITEGTGAGQSRLIVAYTSNKICTLDSNFTTNPNTSSLYNVDAADVHVSLSDADQAQGFVATYTDTTTITLDAAAVATTDYYKGSLIVFTHGTGAGQVREITGYTNGRVVTMSPALAAVLDTTTVWHIQATASGTINDILGDTDTMEADLKSHGDTRWSTY